MPPNENEYFIIKKAQLSELVIKVIESAKLSYSCSCRMSITADTEDGNMLEIPFCRLG